MNRKRRLLIVDVAALGWNAASGMSGGFHKMDTVFPALTCTAQASFRTASHPDAHGMTANGLYFRDTRKPSFWEQASSLVEGGRIWDAPRAAGSRVALAFWQQSLGESVDVVLSPKPVHKHHGGMLQDCYSQPPDLYALLTRRLRRPFNLMHYWGPLASRKSSDWIVASLLALIEDPAPEVIIGYLPHLDYDLQRHGPDSARAKTAISVVDSYLQQLRAACAQHGYDFLFFGDYAIEAVTSAPVFPNRALRNAGLLAVRVVRDMAYPDFHTCRAWALADHQVAHVFARDDRSRDEAAKIFADMDGVDGVLRRDELSALRAGHARAGELVLVARPGSWFAYPWWTDPREAPDYAGHVDIHNKPGYDPCELFFGWPPPGVSRDPARIRGTHGRTGPGTETAWQSSLSLAPGPRTLVELSASVQQWLSE